MLGEVVARDDRLGDRILDRLAARGVPLDGPVAFAKGSTWILDVADGDVTAARYVPPPG